MPEGVALPLPLQVSAKPLRVNGDVVRIHSDPRVAAGAGGGEVAGQVIRARRIDGIGQRGNRRARLDLVERLHRRRGRARRRKTSLSKDGYWNQAKE